MNSFGQLGKSSALLFTSGLLLAYFAIGHKGPIGYDDLRYLELAHDLRQGITHFEDHYFYRFVLIYLEALSIWVLGYSEVAYILPPLLFSLAILIASFYVIRLQAAEFIWLCLLLIVCSEWYLFYSFKLMPDLPVSACIVLAIFMIHHALFGRRVYLIPMGIGLSLILFIGFMCKATIVYIFPTLAFVFLVRIRDRRLYPFWATSLISMIVLLVVYFGVCHLLTGDALARFGAIAQNPFTSFCSYELQSTWILLKRISYQFFAMCISSSIGLGIVLVLPSFISGFRKQVSLSDSNSFFIVVGIVLLLTANFMTTSFEHYAPLCLDPRHYLYLIPIFAIPGSQALLDFFFKKRHAPSLVSSMILVMLISYWLPGNTSKLLYLPMATLFIIRFILPLSRRAITYLFVIGTICVLLLKPISLLIHGVNYDYRGQKKVMMENVLSQEKGTIVTNEVQRRLLIYYQAFSINPQLRILSYDDFNPALIDPPPIFLVRSFQSRHASSLNINDLPYFATSENYWDSILVYDTDLDIQLIRLNPDIRQALLFSSSNSIDSLVPFWGRPIRKIEYQGKLVESVGKYSATLSLPLDSIAIDIGKPLIIQTRLECLITDISTAKLVISIENRGNAEVWQGIDLQDRIKVYSQWNEIQNDLVIDKATVAGSILKVYIWNPQKDLLLLDNFEVTLLQ